MNNLAVKNPSRFDRAIPNIAKIVDYRPDTGEFFWNGVEIVPEGIHYPGRGKHKRVAGKKAGVISRVGYVNISAFDHMVSAHRLAFYMLHGWLPKQVDHINRVRHDNRAVNLRAANHSLNAMNRTVNKSNSTGIYGVNLNGSNGKWKASIRGKCLGHYSDFFEACCVRKSAEIAPLKHLINCKEEKAMEPITQSIDSLHGDEHLVADCPKARTEKISEIAGDILHNTVQMAEAMAYCGTFESQLFNIQIARLAKLAPKSDAHRGAITMKQAMDIAMQAQSIREIVTEDALEYAEHLYDEGNY